MLCVDARAAKNWNGAEGDGSDYENLCAIFDSSPSLPAALVAIGDQTAIAWEMACAGTADIFHNATGTIRIVRAWLAEDSANHLLKLASILSSTKKEIGKINIPSGDLAVFWAPESGRTIKPLGNAKIQRVKATAVSGSAVIPKTIGGGFICSHDEVEFGRSHARRLTLIPADKW